VKLTTMFVELLPNPPPPGSTHPNSDHAECNMESNSRTPTFGMTVIS